jgi:hypothetical protein
MLPPSIVRVAGCGVFHCDKWQQSQRRPFAHGSAIGYAFRLDRLNIDAECSISAIRVCVCVCVHARVSRGHYIASARCREKNGLGAIVLTIVGDAAIDEWMDGSRQLCTTASRQMFDRSSRLVLSRSSEQE